MPEAKINGINIAYSVTGKGEPLLLIMGLSGTQDAWKSQVNFFKDQYQVITFDNRGVGKSDKPAGPFTTRMMAEDAIGLMDHLGIEKANVLGVSMGGMIAQEMAINYPHRIRNLILGCTYACQDKYSSGPTEEMFKVSQLPYRKWLAYLINMAFNKPLYRLFIILQLGIGSLFMAAPDKATLTEGMMRQTEACATHNTLDRLPLIKSPTLVIVGTKDRIIKTSSSEVLAEKIPGAQLVKIKGGSHSFHMEMSGQFNKAVLNFLKTG